jgi:hypothetical protein
MVDKVSERSYYGFAVKPVVWGALASILELIWGDVPGFPTFSVAGLFGSWWDASNDKYVISP